MQLFFFLNDLAGRFTPLDQAMRFFYVSALPALATLFLAQLLVLPRHPEAPSRARIACAIAFSLLLAVFLVLGFEYFSQALGLGVLSPRPFMTRRINLLVVEPQDNSFPCFELTIAAIFAVGMAFSSRKWGMWAGGVTAFLALARMFCGNNYLADVWVGALLGVGITALCGSIFEVRLKLFELRPQWQLGFSSALLALTLGGTYFSLAAMPRFASKLPVFWSSPATAAPHEIAKTEAQPSKATQAARTALQEGEGVVDEHGEAQTAEELALSKRSHLFLPEVEKFLRGKLAPLARPFHLLDVEVAPVKAGNSSYRCAALRFEITPATPDLRRQTAQVAALLVKTAFASDSQLENVDVTAILRGDAQKIDGSEVRFAGDEVPVFTASIQRQNLIVTQPKWANDPNLDGGSWLRARSLLYVNAKILPPSSAVAPEPSSTPAATPQLTQQATPSPTPRAAFTPTATPKATPKVAPIPLKTAPPKPTPRPTPALTPSSAPKVVIPKSVTPKAVVPKAALLPRPTQTPIRPQPTLQSQSIPQPQGTPQPSPTADPTPPVAAPKLGTASAWRVRRWKRNPAKTKRGSWRQRQNRRVQ